MIQSSGKLFGELDEGVRDRAFNKPGLRGVVEVMKSRVSVSSLDLLTCLIE
jgi:DNA repair protein RAD51